MIKIEFQEPASQEWREWRQECDAARDKLLESFGKGKKPQITDLYKDPRMKRVYKSGKAPFYGKCAYCESNVAADNPGDIEHWRPKNRVTDEHARAIEVKAEDGSIEPHPGYYWLAYEWRNLLFSCVDCNRPSTAKTPGRRIGKWDQFPVRDFRATRSGEELRECPILLNPLDEDPADHLEVDETGVMIPKTDRGKACIEIFGLNAREALLGARSECIQDTRARIFMMVGDWLRAHSQRDKEKAMREYSAKAKKIEAGEVPFSACERLVLREYDEKFQGLSDRSGTLDSQHGPDQKLFTSTRNREGPETKVNSIKRRTSPTCDSSPGKASEQLEPYGKELILDLHDCDIARFTRLDIETFCAALCELIEMEPCELHFWDDLDVEEDEQQTHPKTKGISAVQFILTSTIVIHTLVLLKAAYVNIFSCKEFDADKAEKFTAKWFGATNWTSNVVTRR